MSNSPPAPRRGSRRSRRGPPGGVRRPPDDFSDIESGVGEADLEGLPRLSGILQILPDGFGFLRVDGYLPSPDDAYVARTQITKLGLRDGDLLTGLVRRPKQGERQSRPALVRIDEVDAASPSTERPRFDRLPAPPPDERLRLEDNPHSVVGRALDLLAPIGKGQRGLVVSPPKAGKTTILREMARAVLKNHPDVQLIVLLVDERPEEAYVWQETVGERAEVVASTFDRPTPEHLQVSELVLERAKRRVERGQDVMILLDSLTRMARSYNLAAPGTGRVLTGGVEASALDPPKRFFGAARNIKGDGSLTIIASCLIETGSRMDEVIFEEFKGRGNMEVRLDRSLAEKRIFPAISIEGTGTRNDELLVSADELALMWKLRRVLHALSPAEAVEVLLQNIRETPSNTEFLEKIARVG